MANTFALFQSDPSITLDGSEINKIFAVHDIATDKYQQTINCTVTLDDPKPLIDRDDADKSARAKSGALSAIIHTHLILLKHFGYTLADAYNIDIMSDITSMIATGLTVFKQRLSVNGHIAEKASALITRNGHSLHPAFVGPLLIHMFGKYSFSIPREVKNSWLVDVSKMLVYMQSYKLRFGEARNGCTETAYKDSTGRTHTRKAIDFGIDRAFQSTLEGFTYPPHIRNTLGINLGPMTIACQLFGTPSNNFSKKWEDIFDQVFKLLPCLTEIKSIIRQGGVNGKNMMHLLAQLSSLGLARNVNKAYFPAALFVPEFLKGSNIREIAHVNTAIIEDNLKGIDFSGKGMWLMYQSTCEHDYKMRGNFPTNIAREMLVHGIFGTHIEDLMLLKKMTNYTFMNRAGIGRKLLKRNSETSVVTFKPIPFRYVSKLASAAQLVGFSSSKNQVIRFPKFSGEYETHFLDEFESIFRRVSEVQHIGESSQGQVMAKLATLRDDVVKKGLHDKHLCFGTTKFYKMESVTRITWGEEVELKNPGEKPQFFFNNDN